MNLPRCLTCGGEVRPRETGPWGGSLAAKGEWQHGSLHACVSELRGQLKNLRELATRAYENLDDDIENKPMRHSCGRLIAQLRMALGRS